MTNASFLRTRQASPVTRFPAGFRWNWVAVLLAVCSTSMAFAGEETRQDRSLKLFQRRHEECRKQFESEMNALAKQCEAKSFLTDAERIRERGKPVEGSQIDMGALPDHVLPELPRNLPDEELQWRLKLQKLEEEYALDLYRLSREALRLDHLSFAFDLVREAAYHNPDLTQVRGMLGFVREGDEWMTPFARKMVHKKFVDDPTFGWIEKQSVSRYQNGERPFNGRWISVEKERGLRSDFHNAWEVQTEHFEVKTNFSLEKGVQISRALEKFQRFFLQEFAGFFSSREQLEQLFDSGAGSRAIKQKPHLVYFFRTKEEFIQTLKPRQPNIEVANGLYMPADRIAYFFCNDQAQAAVQETLYHEVTHQLLGESRAKNVDVGENSDFWVIEGIACYLESYNPDKPEMTVGDPRHLRIYWARKKALEDGFYVPLKKFTSLGKQAFQDPGNFLTLQDYYNQAAGLTHFFLNYQDGIYKDAFIQYLTQVYSLSERIRRNARLDTLTGQSFDMLDQQYFEHLRSLPEGPPTGISLKPENSQ